MTVCKRVLYSGQVQGVGFRYTTRQLAQQYAIGGSVRNLSDGSVEVLVEGPAEQVEAFLAALGEHMAAYIADRTVTDERPQGSTEFVVRR